MIADASTLASWLPVLSGQPRIALDTEADSLHCYFEKLCLIQISVPGEDVLVDPLAGFDLAPLYSLLKETTLILHGADYDLRLLRRTGYQDAPFIFDTMIAARLTSHTEFSLAALLQRYFNVTLAKASQKANWARRPLPPQMVDYAKNDTRYLLELTAILEGKLRELGRWEWFVQSCQRVVEATKQTRVRDLDSAWRINGSNDFRGHAAAVLKTLWQWRDEEARNVDRPAFHVMNNDELLAVARTVASGGPARSERLQGSRLRRFLQAADVARALPEAEWPRLVSKPRLRATPEQERRFGALKRVRDEAAVRLNLDPSLIASKATIEAIAYDVSAPHEVLMPWQSELLAAALG